MARLIQRLQRLESQKKPAALASLTEEETAFIGQCFDWIEGKTPPDLSALTPWQREMYAACFKLMEYY